MIPHRRWPAEWEPHAATLMIWPHNPGTFRVDRAAKAFRALCRALVPETVHILVSKAPADDLPFQDESNVQVHVCPSNDSWARDTAPTFVVEIHLDHQQRHRLIGLDWQFNAYGGPEKGCYWPCTLDQALAKCVCESVLPSCRHEVPHPQLILEGGSIHTDGAGTILTTKECLLGRNPTMSQQDIESVLLSGLGCQKVIWLDHGLAFDDDTNGHVDNWCCWVEPGAVVLAWTDDEEGDAENYRRCRASYKQLLRESLKIHKLYLPKPMYYTQDIIDSLQFGDYHGCNVFAREVGDRMAGSYVNFYIANDVLLVPQYGDVNADAAALETLRPLFPDRKCVAIDSLEILIGGGNIHCVTQQVPHVDG